MSNLIQLAGNLEDMQEYEPLPDGPYRAELQDAEIKYNEKTPQGFITAQFKVHPDQFPADYDAANAPEGVTVTQGYVALPDPSNRRTVAPFKRFLTALGVDMKGSDFDPQDWVGREVQVLLKRGEYQGALLNNIEAINPLPQV